MLTPEELKFLSIEDLVEVEFFSYIKELSFIHNTYKDISPLTIIKIPFYLALELKNGGLVQIRLPGYYSFDYLYKLVEEEMSNQKEYISIPSNIFCIGKLVIRNSYNCNRKEECIGLIDKLKDIRFKKTLLGLSKIEGRALALNNLTLFEYFEIKEILIRPMEERRKLLLIKK